MHTSKCFLQILPEWAFDSRASFSSEAVLTMA